MTVSWVKVLRYEGVANTWKVNNAHCLGSDEMLEKPGEGTNVTH